MSVRIDKENKMVVVEQMFDINYVKGVYEAEFTEAEEFEMSDDDAWSILITAMDDYEHEDRLIDDLIKKYIEYWLEEQE